MVLNAPLAHTKVTITFHRVLPSSGSVRGPDAFEQKCTTIATGTNFSAWERRVSPTSLIYRVPAAFLNAGRVFVRGVVTPR